MMTICLNCRPTHLLVKNKHDDSDIVRSSLYFLFCDFTNFIILHIIHCQFQLEIGIPTISLVYLQDNQKYVHT